MNRLRTRWLASLLLTVVCAGAASSSDDAETPHSPPSTLSRVLRAFGLETPPGNRGDKAYRRGDHEEALRQYGKAVDEAVSSSPEMPLLNRNIGNALYRQKRYAEAAEYYEEALKGLEGGAGGKSEGGAKKDSAAASKVHHNLGNVFFRKAQAADSSATQEAMADLREAIAHYKKSLRLNPSHRPSKQNLEMANAALQKLIAREQQKQKQQRKQNPKQPDDKPPEPSARAKEALARALQLTQERRYADAAAVLDEILKSDRTAAPFAAHRKRLDDVLKILKGQIPSAAGPGDPRATPWNPGRSRP